MNLFPKLGGGASVASAISNACVTCPGYETISSRHRQIVTELILDIGDRYNVQVKEDESGFSQGLGMLGSLMPIFDSSSPIAAAVGGTSGFTSSIRATYVTFREVWSSLSNTSSWLVVWVYDFLRTIDEQDLENAANIVRASERSRVELLEAILRFIADRLRRTAVSDRRD